MDTAVNSTHAVAQRTIGQEQKKIIEVFGEDKQIFEFKTAPSEK